MNMLYKKPSSKISERMRLIKPSGTRLENELASLLKILDLKYDKQPCLEKIKTRPDFRIKGTNIVLFCDSSFWHGRPSKINNMKFNRNKKFWVEKLKANRMRDARYNKLLKRSGWKVVRFWDTDIVNNSQKVLNKLLNVISENKHE